MLGAPAGGRGVFGHRRDSGTVRPSGQPAPPWPSYVLISPRAGSSFLLLSSECMCLLSGACAC
jgi:hypothetical protein